MHLVVNNEALVATMGSWPSFHDAHVLSAALSGQTCRVTTHVFRSTDQVDADGYYVLVDHHLVELEMRDVSECSLPEDYDGDILFELTIQRDGDSTAVQLDSAVDPDRSWHVRCQAVAVTSVEPCDRSGKPAA